MIYGGHYGTTPYGAILADSVKIVKKAILFIISKMDKDSILISRVNKENTIIPK